MIVKCDYGQIGNRLHTHVNALAWCKKNNFNLLNLSFSQYSSHFISTNNLIVDKYYKNKDFFTFLFSTKIFIFFLNKLLNSNKFLKFFSFYFHKKKAFNERIFNQDDLDFLKSNHRKINLVREWDINNPRALDENSNWIRRVMTPSDYYVEKARDHIKYLKRKFDYIVGVHARRGDYKYYQNGRHYHSWEDYKNWIIQIMSVFESEGYCKLGFLLCSDEAPMKQIFGDLPIHFSNENNMMIDMHMLSLCDFNIGPPSSFGTWISWYGNVPRMTVEKNYSISSSEQFSICEKC